jgi:nucleoside-diphosphate-sugar epimerase
LIKVVVVDVIVPSVRHPRVEYVRASITNVDHLLDAFQGAQSVIHVASLILNVKMRKSKIIEIVNVDGTKAVIEACQKLGLLICRLFQVGASQLHLNRRESLVF